MENPSTPTHLQMERPSTYFINGDQTQLNGDRIQPGFV